MTPMQSFAMDLIKKNGGELYVGRLANDWAVFKHGRARVSSRDRFGCTAAAYKTLRRLEELGHLDGFGQYKFKIKK